MTLHFIILAIYLILCISGFMVLKKNKDFQLNNTEAVMGVILVGGFAVRTVLGLRDVAFWTDINCFKAWADWTASYGLGGMYHQGKFLDYPPGYMYVLALTKLIQSVTGISTSGVLYTYIIKLPAIIADIISSVFIYKTAGEKLDGKWALFLATCFIYCPATIYNSAVWGQIDSWYTMLLVRALYRIYHCKTIQAAVFYAIALLTKPQALLFGPVLLFCMIERKSLKEILKALAAGLGTMYLLSLPFARSLSPAWLINLYSNTFNGYRYMTVNGYNLYMLADMNWKSLSEVTGSESINIIVIGLCFVFCGLGYFRQKNEGKLFSSALVFITVVFSFCTMMHERYMHPAMLLALFSFIFIGRTEYFVLFIGSVTANFLNVAASMLSYYNGYKVLPPLYWAVGLLTIAVCLLSLYTFWTDGRNDNRLTFDKLSREKIMVIALTSFYRIFAFFRLGAADSPQTYYQSKTAEQWFAINFEKTSEVDRIWAFSGMGDQNWPLTGTKQKIGCDFEVLYQGDDGLWRQVTEFDHDYVFTWQKKDVNFSARTVMVRAGRPDQVLNEIVFVDTEGNIIRGTVELDASFDYGRYSPYLALDESETLPMDETYYYSMYFDEIYHGRTAYEQLKGYSIYETTHPPLGKIIISIGIAIFGMTPFGWRFMGTLRGVAMVAIMYAMAKQLMKRHDIAMLCAFIFAFDFMHYTQTRIATVDSYVTMFTMLMFLFMLKYAEIPLEKNNSGQMLYLMLSGIFMGCAIAVKWNGAYGAIGLALFFFISLGRKYSAYVKENSENKKQAVKKCFTTCMWCVLCFVIIPVLIYFTTFAPVLKAQGIYRKIREFISYQQHMFSYHSQLEAEHFFSSMWYTWPVIIKPVWYSVARYGNMVSSISAFGNPAVWLAMIPALVYVAVKTIAKKDSGGLFILLGYLASFLPWVLVTRLAFIYHYFPATVFGVLAVGYIMAALADRLGDKKKYLAVYPVLVFVCFIVFFPVISGLPASQTYVDMLELLPTWYFN